MYLRGADHRATRLSMAAYLLGAGPMPPLQPSDYAVAKFYAATDGLQVYNHEDSLPKKADRIMMCPVSKLNECIVAMTTYPCFHSRESLFNRVDVWRIGWEIQKVHTPVLL
jgi:hypothetical protein